MLAAVTNRSTEIVSVDGRTVCLQCQVFSGGQKGGDGFICGIPHPRFPVKRRGFRELHAPFLKERRTCCHVQGSAQEIRGISLVFREIWDTTALDPRPVR